MPADPPPILLTGATGYVGGRLLAQLLEHGRRVRCATRRPEHLRQRLEADHPDLPGDAVEVVHADVCEPRTLPAALAGVEVAYYLIHMMGQSGTFVEKDRHAAENFADAANAAGIGRIVYLGGLGDEDQQLSKHLRSRQEVGRILRERSGAAVVEFRASIVVGSGSLSFEMVRALVDRLPVMVCPRWLRHRCQPIAVEDVLDYLEAAIGTPAEVGPDGAVFEIGGADAIAYIDLLREYGRQRGLRRWYIPVPLLTPRLSSYWLGLVTPVYAGVGRELIDSLEHSTVVEDRSALDVYPIRPRALPEAVARALAFEDRKVARTRWADTYSWDETRQRWHGTSFGHRLIDARRVDVPVTPEEAFAAVERIGGANGWYVADLLWRIRGWMDLAVGGVGLRRGRREPSRLVAGDPLDFWRVETVRRPAMLRLFAEMKLPGRAWLQFEVRPCDDGRRVTVVQTAIFDPVGLLGLAYWYAVLPFHGHIFRGMLRGVARQALAHATDPGPLAEGDMTVRPVDPDALDLQRSD